MSTVAAIEAALPRLSTEDLQRLEKALYNQFRERGSGQPAARLMSPRLANPEAAQDFKKTLVKDAVL